MVWTGLFANIPWPDCDEARLVAEFGTDAALDLLPQVRELKDDFYSSEAIWTVRDLGQAGDRAAAEFRARHPEISGDAVRAFKWCYVFDYK